MSVFPRRVFTEDSVLIRTGPTGLRQRYDSLSLGKKSLGQVKGVYVGFIPGAAINTLTLSPDPTEGHSTLKVPSRLDPAGIDLIVTAPISLDFSATLVAEFLPDGINVKARAYYSETGQATAQIITETRTITLLVHTVPAAPASFDLATIIALGAIEPGSVTFNINVNGSGPDTITDDGNGTLVAAGTGLPAGGTVDYQAGTFTGVTSALTALSNVNLTFTRCSGPDEVLLCVVTGSPGAIAVNSTPPFYGAPTERDVPIAFPGCTIPYGFLEAGAVEDLEAAVEILNEVIAARTDLQGVPHLNLKERLDVDLGADAMATRLGKTLRSLRGNTVSVSAGASSVNVSGSLGEFSRTYAPNVAINGGGSETVIGAATDSTQNVCFIVNADTGARLHDNETDRNVVVGRLTQDADVLLDGVVTFTNAIQTVTGAGTDFVTQVAVGDLIQAPDGRFYEVASISSVGQLGLTSAYQGATAASAGLLRRRFLLRFSKANSDGSEPSITLSAAVSIDFYFPAFMGVNTASFDNSNTMHAPGERTPIPAATTLVPGKVELANNSSPFAGSILLREKGTPVAGGPFHTLNFTGGNIIELAPGVLDVVTIGGIGPTGPGGGLGPPGDQGDPGPDLQSISTFEKDLERPLPTGGIVTFNVSFGYPITYLSGGIATVRDAFFMGVGEDYVLTDLSIDGGTLGTSATVVVENPLASGGTGDMFVRLYLDAAGLAP